MSNNKTQVNESQHGSRNFSRDELLGWYERYQREGFIPFPLRGNNASSPDEVKTPAVSRWNELKQPPGKHALEHFIARGNDGIGVLCGDASHKICLDFDSAECYEEFAAEFPVLTETRIHLSGKRKFPHVWFEYSPEFQFNTVRVRGKLDLLGNGAYAVVPPTQAKGYIWTIKHDTDVFHLDHAEIRRLKDWIEQLKLGSLVARRQQQPSEQLAEIEHLITGSLQEMYKHYRLSNARNNSLYLTASRAKGAGIDEAECIEQLLDLFVRDVPDTYAEYQESVPVRTDECLRTIESAYRGTGFRPKGRTQPPADAMPRAALETMVKEDLVDAAIVYGRLRRAGITGDTVLTEKEIIAITGCNRRMVSRATAPIPSHSDDASISTDSTIHIDRSNYLFSICNSRGKKGDKTQSKGGRPPKQYRILTNTELCKVLGVSEAYYDVMPEWAFDSAKDLRKALLYTLIRRRPGQYSKRWFAKMLGVDEHTVFSYLRELNIEITPQVSRELLTVKHLPRLARTLEDLRGMHLEDGFGQHHLALSKKAVDLLMDASRWPIMLVKQEANHYRVKE